MPAVTSGLILVTGASGFIGSYVCRELVKQGFDVRATVRTAAKGEYVRSLVPGREDKVGYVVVPDMNMSGAYDGAVIGANGVIHLASPFDFSVEDPKDFIEPAVAGVTEMFTSLSRLNPSVKRIVQLSSVLSAGLPMGGPKTVNESDWNDMAVQIVEKDGKSADGFLKYSASKTLAERKFWDLLAKGGQGFDGVSILPALVLGKTGAYSTGNGVDGSLGAVVPWLNPGVVQAQLEAQLANIVDVRDIATASVKALQVPQAGGERLIVSAHSLFGNDIAIAAARAYPDASLNPGSTDLIAELNKTAVVFDGSKAARILNFRYNDYHDTLDDTVKDVYPKVHQKH